jgi:spermidine synthase
MVLIPSSSSADSGTEPAGHPGAAAAPRGLVPLLAALFFLSGLSALVYQVLWLRLLGLVFGVTVYAASTVLASFMAGLAVGSFAAGRVADRLRRPLLWFAAAECLIALSALATPAALEALQVAYVQLSPALPGSVAVLTLARFAMSFAVLIVPTGLMGATLPLIVRSSLFRIDTLGARVGVLYGTNTAGAIAGTLAAGLYLIPVLGIARTFLVAAAVNLLVAAVAAVAGLRLPRARSPLGVSPAAPAEAAAEGGEGLPSRTRAVILAVFGISGFASLALEVIWFRSNVLLIRPTAYAFAAMLSAVLAGIAIGSWLVAPLLSRRWNWIAVLAALELAIVFTALGSFRALMWSVDLTARLGPALERIMPAYLPPLFITSLVTMFPAMLLFGAAFPLGIRLWTAGGPGAEDRVAGRIGVFYAVNVVGSILGSLAAGFLLLPLAGSRVSLIIVCAVVLASAVMLLLVVPGLARARALSLAAAATLAFVLVARAVGDPFDVFLQHRYPGQPLLWLEEGVQTTVSVNEVPSARGGRRAMYLDGLHQASNIGPMVTVHRRVGHLPMALHPEPRRALVIGLGGGVTAGAVSQHPGVEVDVVELSPGVVRAASFFDDVNYGVTSRANVRIRLDDGRNYLMLARDRYDVITADVIVPIHAGAGNVYSAEYFRLAHRVLKDDGVMLQWVYGAGEEYRLIARTFMSVFPHVTVWDDGSLLVGSKRPLQLDAGDFAWKLQVPETAAALEAAGIGSLEGLQAMYRGDGAALARVIGPGPILTDDRPMVEYFLSLAPGEPVNVSALSGRPADVWPHLRSSSR